MTSSTRHWRRTNAKAKRDMFVRRGIVSARIFRFPAPTPHAQGERLKLIDRLIAIADRHDFDPIRVYETVARARHKYDAALHGQDDSVEWFDDYSAQLLIEKELRDACP